MLPCQRGDGNHFCASLLLLKGATKPQTTQEENAASLWQCVGTKGPHPHQSGQCLEPQLGSELMITLGYFKHQTNRPAWLTVQDDALSSLPACWCTFLQQGRKRERGSRSRTAMGQYSYNVHYVRILDRSPPPFWSRNLPDNFFFWANILLL